MFLFTAALNASLSNLVFIAGFHFIFDPNVSYEVSSNHKWCTQTSAVILFCSSGSSLLNSFISSAVERCRMCSLVLYFCASSIAFEDERKHASLDRMKGCILTGTSSPYL